MYSLEISINRPFSCWNLSIIWFSGRKKHIAKSPSLNIEQNDVTDGSGSNCVLGEGNSDEQLLTLIEQQIFNDESKTKITNLNTFL